MNLKNENLIIIETKGSAFQIIITYIKQVMITQRKKHLIIVSNWAKAHSPHGPEYSS